ncbi:leucine-rich repeat domain-containing protein [Paenibacillus ginsengarvi]|uniref:Leucine-rich repeat domain-containing protein n=1 Tax=Paenibacillus ginsengarvi TaxID=400777 RepID=A0A3B0CQF4_9BACL|nr:leucine-rich repeat domain-containing protein [Paenibacillus ginsengarvi]RKN86099.1 leucine-rich repeat domain-containing protein [Paenibacillus ginsengarvi]
MDFIKLTCPNCNGKIEYKEGRTFKCPYCETELLLKENNVVINNYYGSGPVQAKAQPKPNYKPLFLVPFLVLCAIFVYVILNNNTSEPSSSGKVSVRTMPESEVLLSFLKDILHKGTAMPTEEEIAKIRYLSTRYVDYQWHFAYSLDDPFTNKQAVITDYVVMDKVLNTQRIEQKDFEAFSGLTELNLMGEYQISQSEKASFRHLQGLKSYTGGFNESFRRIADYFGDKAKVEELSIQIRSNAELALLLEFPKLRSLEISYVDESVTDFQLLSQLPLKSLFITRINDLRWLASLTGLESLAVSYSEATDFSALYSLSQLQALKLTFVKNLKTLDFVQNMPNLQSLDLNQVGVTNLDRLRNKTSLTKLYLSAGSQMGSMEFINSLTSLTELTISSYSGSIPALYLPNLKQAELKDAFLPKLEAPAIKTLTVYVRGGDMDGANLVKYSQLEQLTLMEYGSFKGISSLNQLPNLRTLLLNETAFFSGADALFNLQHVTTIDCNKCWFQLNSQSPFANNTLEHLTLNHPSFRIGKGDDLKEMDQAMPYFANMTALRSFTLQDSSLQSLQFLKNWQQIEELHLENNAISDVEPLVNLPKLKILYLVGNQVQNKSVLDKDILVY